MSSVIVDPNKDEAYVDMRAMHARSDVERRVRYLPNREDVPNGLLYWIVWVTVEHNENGPYYHGVAGSELRIDRSIKRGYKSMPEHVKQMEKSLAGEIVVAHMDEHSKKLLRDFLIEFHKDMWYKYSDELEQEIHSTIHRNKQSNTLFLNFLNEFNEDMWNNSSDVLKEELPSTL